MSLINEALKRTRDATYQSPAGQSVTGAQYRIAAGDAPFVRRTGAWWNWLVVAVVAGAVVVTGLQAVRPVQVEPVAPAAPVAVVETVPVSALQVVPPVAPPATEEELMAKVMNRIKAEQAAAKPVAPKLSLQGIMQQGEKREALINGYSVHVGEAIEGAQVVTIDSRRVTLRFGDEEIVLRMP
jgi:hypothetical protein